MLRAASMTHTFKMFFGKTVPHCPINPNHSVSTNLFGEWVCVNCASKISDLKRTVQKDE